MKNLRRNFNRFCHKNRNKGIPNLMLYITVASALVYLLSLTNGGAVVHNALCFNKGLILQGQVWRLFSYVFTYSIGGNPILVVVSLLCIYSLSRYMEAVWGTLRFNLFYLGGVLLMDVFAMIFCPVPGAFDPANQEAYYLAIALEGFYSARMIYYLNLTLLVAYATMNPDAQFVILFVLPVKAWLLGALYLLLNAIEIFNLCYPTLFFPHCLFPLVGFANYLLFFGKDVLNLIPLSWRVKAKRTVNPKPTQSNSGPIPFRSAAAQRSGAASKPNYTHRCTVCGRTDVSNPELEFRYCSRCNGYHCYCQDHINDHTHIQ